MDSLIKNKQEKAEAFFWPDRGIMVFLDGAAYTDVDVYTVSRWSLT